MLWGCNKNPSSRWWFQIFYIFTPTWRNDPIWLIFFKGVETTKQFIVFSRFNFSDSLINDWLTVNVSTCRLVRPKSVPPRKFGGWMVFCQRWTYRVDTSPTNLTNRKFLLATQGGPLPVITVVITPISRVITPVTHLCSAIYRGPITPFINGLGAHLATSYFSFKLHQNSLRLVWIAHGSEPSSGHHSVSLHNGLGG